MKPSERIPSGNEIEALSIINSFVGRQRALVIGLRGKLGKNPDVFSLRTFAPKMIDALDDTWALAVHGVGVRFVGTKTGAVVDAHVGLFDSPDAFDAWRLESYAESIRSGLEDFGPILERLASKGLVSRHESLANHYELPPFHDAS